MEATGLLRGCTGDDCPRSVHSLCGPVQRRAVCADIQFCTMECAVLTLGEERAREFAEPDDDTSGEDSPPMTKGEEARFAAFTAGGPNPLPTPAAIGLSKKAAGKLPMSPVAEEKQLAATIRASTLPSPPTGWVVAGSGSGDNGGPSGTAVPVEERCTVCGDAYRRPQYVCKFAACGEPLHNLCSVVDADLREPGLEFCASDCVEGALGAAARLRLCPGEHTPIASPPPLRKRKSRATTPPPASATKHTTPASTVKARRRAMEATAAAAGAGGSKEKKKKGKGTRGGGAVGKGGGRGGGGPRGGSTGGGK
jgi:hypothetical protein